MTALRLLLAALFAAGATLSTTAAFSARAADDGRQLYLRDCAICHGAVGAGTTNGPSLENAGPAAVDYYISTGRMPLLKTARTETRGRPEVPAPGRFAFDSKMSPARRTPPYSPSEMDALIRYTSTLAGPGVDVAGVDLAHGDVARGGELFRVDCAACHSWAGEGGALLDREAPSLAAASRLQAAEAIRVGPGAMPSFGPAALDDNQLADVVAYVKYLQHAKDPGGSSLWHLGPFAEGAVALVVGLAVLVIFLRWIGERG